MQSSVLLFLNIGSSEMVLIVFVALLLFGGEKLPEIARGLGKGIRDFKDASEGVKREINNQINSYEEKREDKKMEEAAVAIQQAPQNELPAHTETSTESIIRPAENTMPVNENHFSPVVSTEAENHEVVHAEHVTENHVDVPHSDAGTTNEPIKNL
jgi:sec-independent protein translocase protein TatA